LVAEFGKESAACNEAYAFISNSDIGSFIGDRISGEGPVIDSSRGAGVISDE